MIRIGRIALILLALDQAVTAQGPQAVAPGRVSSANDRPIASAPTPAVFAAIESDLQAGRFREAQARSQEVIKLHPQNALAWTYLGMAAVRLGQPQQAIDAFERAITADPTKPGPYLDLALLYASRNEIDKAIDRYEKGLSIDRRNGGANFNYGRLLTARGRFAEAAKALGHSVEINPADMDARVALVEALLGAGQRQRAVEQSRVILQTSGVPPMTLVTLGGVLVRARQLDLARSALTQAASIAPDSAGAYVELSRLYLARNENRSAVQAARRAVELTHDSLESNLALAEALISSRENMQAVELLLKHKPRFDQSAAFHYTLGIAQYRASQFRPAILSLEKAVQLDPQLDLAQFLLGQTSLDVGDLELAESSFKQAISLKPDNTLYYNYLARVYEQKGEEFHEAALEVTRKALAVDPKDIDSRERLAKWARDEGDLPRARALLEGIVADDPSVLSARVILASIYYRLKLRKEGDEQQRAIRALEAEAQKRDQAHSNP